MKLLICTQKVDKNDPILGFFHRWIEEFATQCESIIVICLEKGEYTLPENVQVLSLGKEGGVSRLKYIYNFYRYIWKERKKYDSIFVHMNQVYVILGGLLWRILGKKISIWYTHKSVTFSLRVAEGFVDTIFTASKKSFRLKSKKVMVVGHGIDTSLFSPEKYSNRKDDTILTVGRISESKQIIKMLDILKDYPSFKLVIVGSPVTKEDFIYRDRFLNEVEQRELNNQVEIVGDVPQGELPPFYAKAKVFINLSVTGSLDKAVLEALSMNVPVYTTNEAFNDTEYPVNHSFTEALNSKKETRSYIVELHSLQKLIQLLSKHIV